MTNLHYDNDNATVYEQHCFTIENMLQAMNDNEQIDNMSADPEFAIAFGNLWESFYDFHNNGYSFRLTDLQRWNETLLIPIVNDSELLADLDAIYNHMRDIAA